MPPHAASSRGEKSWICGAHPAILAMPRRATAFGIPTASPTIKGRLNQNHEHDQKPATNALNLKQQENFGETVSMDLGVSSLFQY